MLFIQSLWWHVVTKCHFPSHIRISWLINDHGRSGISWLSMGSLGAWPAYCANNGYEMLLFLIADVMPCQKRDTLARRIHESASKCVLWILSSMAGLIDFGMTACCPLYTIKSPVHDYLDHQSCLVGLLHALSPARGAFAAKSKNFQGLVFTLNRDKLLLRALK